MHKRYNKKFVGYLESKCQESGHFNSVDDQYYENFLALTKKEMTAIVMQIIGDTAGAFNRKLFSGVWDSDDDMYAFVMTFLELVAEGKLVFNKETGKIGFCKPVGDPPSVEMWNRIQEKIESSRPAIREAILRNVRGH